jgi:prolyl 4-hydroxylase
MDRIQTGQVVHDRLTAAAGVQRVPADAIDLYIRRDFLDAATCEALNVLIDARRAPSPLFAENPDPEFRTSETCNLDPSDPAVQRVEAALYDLIGLPSELGERLQGQRYATGQQFKPHHDYLNEASTYWPRQREVGGQRTWTAMIFLDAPEEGGATHFPLIGVTVPPRRGSLIAWNNLDAAGQPNRQTLHQGMPVTAGVKHIVTKWWRERPWGPPGITGRG